MPAVATLHLQQVHGIGVVKAVGRMVLDRRRLASATGLRFAKLLGTGDGATFTPRDADLYRWGMFAVWDSIEAVDRFDAEPRWAFADERARIDLQPLRWRGRWARRDPFAGCVGPETSCSEPDRVAPKDCATTTPIAALTRARVRPTQWLAFGRAVPPVANASNRADGRRFAIGIGEAPIGLQGTFSMWESAAALDAFAYATPAHREVIQRTRSDGWYAEELFARFAVMAIHGSIVGLPS